MDATQCHCSVGANPRLFEGNGCLVPNGKKRKKLKGVFLRGSSGFLIDDPCLVCLPVLKHLRIKYTYPRQNVGPLLKVELFVDYIKNTHKGANIRV